LPRASLPGRPQFEPLPDDDWLLSEAVLDGGQRAGLIDPGQ